MEYLHQPDFKYLSALAAFYIRLTFDSTDVYKTLEPLLADYRKIRRRARDGAYSITNIDQFVDDLLRKERVCGTSFRKLPPRAVLEDLGQLEARESPLAEEIEAIDNDDEEERRSGGNKSDSEVEEVEMNGHSNGRNREST